jgi:hypothetical protein
MQANMEFFHRKAGELMAVIMSLPTLTRDEATDAQVQALKEMAGLLKMREMAQMCARDLARYTHPPLAPKPFSAAEEKPSGPGAAHLRPGIQVIPTPRAVSEAFRRVAEGLPLEPQKRL